MVYVLDRFEGSWAVIEHKGETFTLPRELLPEDARDGDVLNIAISVDRSSTRERACRVQRLTDTLFKE